VGEQLRFEFTPTGVAQWAGAAVEDRGGDGRVDGGMQVLSGGQSGAHAFEQAAGVQQPEAERRGCRPGQQCSGCGVQEDPVVGQQLVPMRGEQQRAGGLAGTFRSERERRFPVAHCGAGVQDRPPVGFELDPDQFASDPRPSQAQPKGLGTDPH
jgi:hypothetical protein